MKATIVFTDLIGKRKRVNVTCDFDPPLKRGIDPSPAQCAAIEMLRGMQGEASRARVHGSGDDGPVTVDLDDLDDLEV